jgi:hypothetical protein
MPAPINILYSKKTDSPSPIMFLFHTVLAHLNYLNITDI